MVCKPSLTGKPEILTKTSTVSKRSSGSVLLPFLLPYSNPVCSQRLCGLDPVRTHGKEWS